MKRIQWIQGTEFLAQLVIVLSLVACSSGSAGSGAGSAVGIRSSGDDTNEGMGGIFAPGPNDIGTSKSGIGVSRSGLTSSSESLFFSTNSLDDSLTIGAHALPLRSVQRYCTAASDPGTFCAQDLFYAEGSIDVSPLNPWHEVPDILHRSSNASPSTELRELFAAGDAACHSSQTMIASLSRSGQAGLTRCQLNALADEINSATSRGARALRHSANSNAGLLIKVLGASGASGFVAYQKKTASGGAETISTNFCSEVGGRAKSREVINYDLSKSEFSSRYLFRSQTDAMNELTLSGRYRVTSAGREIDSTQSRSLNLKERRNSSSVLVRKGSNAYVKFVSTHLLISPTAGMEKLNVNLYGSYFLDKMSIAILSALTADGSSLSSMRLYDSESSALWKSGGFTTPSSGEYYEGGGQWIIDPTGVPTTVPNATAAPSGAKRFNFFDNFLAEISRPSTYINWDLDEQSCAANAEEDLVIEVSLESMTQEELEYCAQELTDEFVCYQPTLNGARNSVLGFRDGGRHNDKFDEPLPDL